MKRGAPDLGSRRAARVSASPLSASEIEGFVRRFGFVLNQLLQTMISSLIRTRDEKLAEDVNDMLKPCVDYLLHFDLGAERLRLEDETVSEVPRDEEGPA